MSDPVNSPQHYRAANGLEAIDVIEGFGLDRSFRLGNALKYLLRAGRKGDALEDLRKARWYLDREYARMEASDAGYDADADLGGSVRVGLAAVQARVANGGAPWPNAIPGGAS